jgi:prepilin-type N-terminal cleavage/methylation domain-containing protein
LEEIQMTVAKKQGFTIVELLVVITIIGFLMALLFPAINSVRVVARRGQCLSRQRQLGEGILNYTTRKDEFPARIKARPLRHEEETLDNPPEILWCWVPFILPYTDSTSLYDFLADSGGKSWNGDANDTISGSADGPKYVRRIDTLICPADPPPSVNAAALSYVVNAGVPDGTDGYDSETSGVFFRHEPRSQKSRWVRQSLTYITDHDGTSQTIMLSENVNADVWGWGVTTTETGIDKREPQHSILWNVAGQVQLNGPIEDFALKGACDAVHARPSSRHPAGFVVTWCSGSTRFISEHIGAGVYFQIMTPNGHELGHQPLSEGSLEQ